MNNKGFKKVYSAPGYPIDPKLEEERKSATPDQKFVPIFVNRTPWNVNDPRNDYRERLLITVLRLVGYSDKSSTS